MQKNERKIVWQKFLRWLEKLIPIISQLIITSIIQKMNTFGDGNK